MPQILGKEVGPISYGLMGLTWRPTPAPEEQAFAAMRASLAAGCNFWNAGEFYGTPEYNSLHLLKKYFTKYPEDAEKVVLSVKGGIDLSKFAPDGTPEGIERSVGNCVKLLGGTKKIDVFECARVDPNTPIEVTMKALDEQVKAGTIGGIALSEASANTTRRAAKVVKLVAVEQELSLWALEILSNGVLQACAELDIPIVAYSPIGRGMLTGEFTKPSDLPEGDIRKSIPRFSSEEYFAHNLQLVQQLQDIAKEKGITPAQLAINWVASQSQRNGNPLIIPIPGATTAARVNENAKVIKLSDEELEKIGLVLQKFEVKGQRNGLHDTHVHG